MNANKTLNSLPVANTQVTLQPILDSGPSALDTHGHTDIQGVKLASVTVSFESDPPQQITITGEHILDSNRPQTTIPPNATLSSATLLFSFPEADHPRYVYIQPPFSIVLESQADAPRIFPWLDDTGYLIAKQLTHAILIAALTLSLALGQTLGDGDGDDDDPSCDRKVLLN